MDGFKKINLDTSETAYTQKNNRNMVVKKSIKKKCILMIGLFLFVLFVVIGVFSTFTILMPAKVVYKDIQKTAEQVKITLGAVKHQNIQLASEELDKTKKELTQVQKDLEGLTILKYIPFANLYYGDAKRIIKAGFHGLSAAEVLIESVEPYADILGLKGQGSFVGGTASQRIETAVKTMGKITPYIDEIAKYT